MFHARTRNRVGERNLFASETAASRKRKDTERVIANIFIGSRVGLRMEELLIVDLPLTKISPGSYFFCSYLGYLFLRWLSACEKQHVLSHLAWFSSSVTLQSVYAVAGPVNFSWDPEILGAVSGTVRTRRSELISTRTISCQATNQQGDPREMRKSSQVFEQHRFGISNSLLSTGNGGDRLIQWSTLSTIVKRRDTHPLSSFEPSWISDKMAGFWQFPRSSQQPTNAPPPPAKHPSSDSCS